MSWSDPRSNNYTTTSASWPRPQNSALCGWSSGVDSKEEGEREREREREREPISKKPMPFTDSCSHAGKRRQERCVCFLVEKGRNAIEKIASLAAAAEEATERHLLRTFFCCVKRFRGFSFPDVKKFSTLSPSLSFSLLSPPLSPFPGPFYHHRKKLCVWLLLVVGRAGRVVEPSPVLVISLGRSLSLSHSLCLSLSPSFR